MMEEPVTTRSTALLSSIQPAHIIAFMSLLSTILMVSWPAGYTAMCGSPALETYLVPADEVR